MASETSPIPFRPAQNVSDLRSNSEPATIMSVPGGRVPPHAAALERSVLGMIFVDSNLAADLEGMLTEEHFYEPRHATIYRAVQKLITEGRTPDLVQVRQKLQEMNQLEAIGGTQFLASFTREMATPRLIQEHVRVVIQKYLQRELIRAGSQIVDDAYDQLADVEDLLEEAEQKIFKIHQSSMFQDVQDARSVVNEALDIVSQARENQNGVSGVHTGFNLIDQATGGWAKGNLIIIAARPSMGKTALAMNMARNMAIDYGLKVAFFSLEMPSSHLMLRLLIAESELDGKNVRAGNLTQDEWAKFNSAAVRLSELPLYFDDSQNMGIGEFRSKCRRLKQREEIDVIMVDYLQLMSAPMDHRFNREQEVSQVSRTLKAIAKELKVPVISLAQLSRAGDQRTNKSRKPILSDLRESGAIEQDADVVAFIHRPERIGITEYPDHTPTDGIAEFIIAKNRDGVTGTYYLKFEPEFTRFSDSLPQINHDDPNNSGMMGAESIEIQQFSSRMNNGETDNPPAPMSGISDKDFFS